MTQADDDLWFSPLQKARVVPLEPQLHWDVEQLRASLPESPVARIGRLEAEVGFSLAEGLVTSGRDDLYGRTPGDRNAVAWVFRKVRSHYRREGRHGPQEEG